MGLPSPTRRDVYRRAAGLVVGLPPRVAPLLLKGWKASLKSTAWRCRGERLWKLRVLEANRLRGCAQSHGATSKHGQKRCPGRIREMEQVQGVAPLLRCSPSHSAPRCLFPALLNHSRGGWMDGRSWKQGWKLEGSAGVAHRTHRMPWASGATSSKHPRPDPRGSQICCCHPPGQ